jgi:hypothetical protein
MTSSSRQKNEFDDADVLHISHQMTYDDEFRFFSAPKREVRSPGEEPHSISGREEDLHARETSFKWGPGQLNAVFFFG